MKFIIDEQSEFERIDLFLSEAVSEFSRSKIQKWIKEEKILVNDKSIKPSYILKCSDVIDLSEETTTQQLPQAEDIELNIVWEDENMAVINKPSGMLTHPTVSELNGTLVNALMFKYGDNLSDLNGFMRKGIVHRLDRNTSGLIMIAKNNQTHEFLVNEMKEKKFCKKYIAVVKGQIDTPEFDINAPIGRNPKSPNKQCVTEIGKPSLTKVKVLKYLEGATLVELTLVTGRTHQIRVHMSHIGHPVYNDTLYGFGKIKIKTEEQVLQSYKLEFTKPFSQQRIQLEIPYDDKVSKIINTLRIS